MVTRIQRSWFILLAGLGAGSFSCGGDATQVGGDSGVVYTPDTGAPSVQMPDSAASGTGSGSGGSSGGSTGSGGGSSGVANGGSSSGEASSGGGTSSSGAVIDAGGFADDASNTRTDSGSVAQDSSSGGPGPDASTGGFKPCPPRGTPCVIMPLGDSITFGYVSPNNNNSGGYRVELFTQAIADNHSITFVGSNSNGPDMVSGQPFPKANEGHSGYLIDTIGTRQGISPLVDQAIATYKPNIVLLMIGTNDMHYALDVANAPTRLGNLLDKITTDKSDALVVVAKIVAAKGAQDPLALNYNAAMPAVVQARVAKGKHIVLVDMYTALGPWGTGAGASFSDSEHPSIAGYALMAHTWYPAISAYLP